MYSFYCRKVHSIVKYKLIKTNETLHPGRIVIVRCFDYGFMSAIQFKNVFKAEFIRREIPEASKAE